MDVFRAAGREASAAESRKKKKKLFLKQRGHSVTSTSEEYINTELDLSILWFAWPPF